jgi:hypothetical protein
MSTQPGPGRGALVGGLVAVLAIAIGVWLMTSEKAPEAAPSAVTAATEHAPDQPVFSTEHDPAHAAPLTSDKPAVKPIAPVVDGGADQTPIVATGKVSWAGGPLPADVDVVLYSVDGEELDSTTADANGQYALRWDEPLLAGWAVGTWGVSAKLGERSVDLTPDNVGPLPLHLPKEPPVAVDLVLGLAPRLVGNVHDRLTGAPLAMAMVNVGSLSRAWSMDTTSVMTDEQGNYELEIGELPLRGLMVWATADEHVAQMAGPQDLAPAAQPDATLRFDFALEVAAPWRGRVVAASGGQPIEGATITLGSDYAALEDVADFEVTDQNGEFELDAPDMPAQGAWIHVYTDEDEYGAAFVRDAQPGQDLLIRLGLRPTLTGRVLIGKDKPAALADVVVYFDGEPVDGMNGLSDEERTEPDGSFTLPLQYSPLDSSRLRIEAIGCATWEARLADIMKGGGTELSVEVQLVETP